jgi:hypothetical protein
MQAFSKRGSFAMLSRRELPLLLLFSSLSIKPSHAAPDPADAVIGQDVGFEQLTFPPFDALDAPEVFGYSPPTEAEREESARNHRCDSKGADAFCNCQKLCRSVRENGSRSDFAMACAQELEPSCEGIFLGDKPAR